MFTYPRGSEWTQWDLHIHTPATLLANAFTGSSLEEKWKEYFAAVAASGLHGIAPTNYFCLDGVEEVIRALKAGHLGQVKCVLPNIEFRIEQSNKDGKNIHIHVIFADRFCGALTCIREFLNNLELLQTAPGEKALRCTRETVSEYGADKLIVPWRTLREALRKSFTPLDDYIMAAGARGEGGFRPGRTNARSETVAIEIDRSCDLIYGSTEDDRAFFLNQKGERYEDAVRKPVVCCSDAHDHETIGSRRVWIRANPTYEGLKQVIFEPELRVSLMTPADGVSPYHQIESICFSSPEDDPELFQKSPVLFNGELTAIIGGKSTGKSLLLHYLAKTIDGRQVADSEGAGTRTAPTLYEFEESRGFDVLVRWADGHEQALSRPASDELSRKIVYIPQRFLNGLCELNLPAGDRRLDDFTRQALERRPALHAAFSDLRAAREAYRKNIRETLDRLFDHVKASVDSKKTLTDLGDEEGVLKELERLGKEIGALRAASRMTPEQIAQYDALTKTLSGLAIEEATLRADDDEIAKARDASLRAARQLEGSLATLLGALHHAGVKAAAGAALKPIRDLSPLCTTAFDALAAKSAAYSKDLGIKRAQTQKTLEPLASSVKGREQLAALEKKKSDEDARLAKIKHLTQTRKQHVEAIWEEVDIIADHTRELLNACNATLKSLRGESDALGDVSFTAQLSFNEPGFDEQFVQKSVNVTSLRTYLKLGPGQVRYEFAPGDHADYVKHLVTGILTGKVKPMKDVSLRAAVEALLEDRLLIDYQIEYQADRIEHMSPGKRALVVLKILLELSNDEWPILLDQPDDDLDSRSVYRDLVGYFKSKKRKRQIILVTHNPNLVVGADADSVIVANQRGQEPGRENDGARFEYVSGGLETTFRAKKATGVLHQQGIREHVCEVLEGGADAFRERERKYGLHVLS